MQKAASTIHTETDSAFQSTVDLSLKHSPNSITTVRSQASLDNSRNQMNDSTDQLSFDSDEVDTSIGIMHSHDDLTRLQTKAAHLTSILRDVRLENTQLQSLVHQHQSATDVDKSQKIKLSSSRVTQLAQALGRDRWSSRPKASTALEMKDELAKLRSENKKLSQIYSKYSPAKQMLLTPVPGVYLCLMLALSVQVLVIIAILWT